jgi:hypothetical protein
VLRRELGDGFWIVEEGLNGRTTVWDDPLEPFRSGKELLVACLLTRQPIDLVIIMLGTNDLKAASGWARATSRRALDYCSTLFTPASAVGGSASRGTPPLSPPVGRLGLFAEEFAGAVERSCDLARHYAAVADARSCPWIDAGAHVRSSDTDGIHLDTQNHEQLDVVTTGSPLLA